MRSSIPYAAPPPPTPLPPQADTPPEIKAFLSSRNWSYSGDNPVTGDELWYNHERHGYFTWAEAMAFEFYRFINLGAGNPP